MGDPPGFGPGEALRGAADANALPPATDSVHAETVDEKLEANSVLVNRARLMQPDIDDNALLQHVYQSHYCCTTASAKKAAETAIQTAMFTDRVRFAVDHLRFLRTGGVSVSTCPTTEASRLPLSRWLHIMNATKAYPYARGDISAIHETQVAPFVDAIVSTWEAMMVKSGPKAAPKVRVWMLDGAGHRVFHLLSKLEYKWSGALDDRLELTLVDHIQRTNDFHEWAIPCAHVRRGNAHALLAKTAAGDLPHVSFLNFSKTGAQHEAADMYEPGCLPPADFMTADQIKSVASSCEVLLAQPGSKVIVSSPRLGHGPVGERLLKKAIRSRGRQKLLSVHALPCQFGSFSLLAVAQTATVLPRSSPSGSVTTPPANDAMVCIVA
jgi:hypothetical protein